MQVIIKKMLLSIVTVLFVFVTMVATTYAWVGILTYSGTGDFDINLKTQKVEKDYSLIISSDGKKFDSFVPLVDIKRQISKNRYGVNKFIDFDTASDDEINGFFQNHSSLYPVTTDSNLTSFKKFDLDNHNEVIWSDSKDFFKFDLYISVDPTNKKIEEATINTGLYLSKIEKTLSDALSSGSFIDGNPHKSVLPAPYNILNNIPNTFTVNAKNATRLAIEVYNPVAMDDYSNNSSLYKRIIYQGGSTEPSYDEVTKVYDLGGNLPDEYNTAIKEINKIRPNYNLSNKNNDILNRNDLDLVESNALLYTAPFEALAIDNNQYNYLGIQNGIRTKVKLSIYFWFEGWDADCLMSIQQKPISMDLTFSSSYIAKDEQ